MWLAFARLYISIYRGSPYHSHVGIIPWLALSARFYISIYRGSPYHSHVGNIAAHLSCSYLGAQRYASGLRPRPGAQRLRRRSAPSARGPRDGAQRPALSVAAACKAGGRVGSLSSVPDDGASAPALRVSRLFRHPWTEQGSHSS